MEKCLEKITNHKINTRNVSNNTYVDMVGKIVHVHGLCDQFPLMGLNDVEQIKNSELANDNKFIKFLIKPLLNEENRMGNASSASNIIAASRIICIYGMSLGETDMLWWNKVISWLNGSNDRHLIVFEHDDKFSRASQFGWVMKMDALLEKFQSFNKNDGIKVESLRERIHLSLEDIFAYPLIKEENVNNNEKKIYGNTVENLQVKIDNFLPIDIEKEELSNPKEVILV